MFQIIENVMKSSNFILISSSFVVKLGVLLWLSVAWGYSLFISLFPLWF